MSNFPRSKNLHPPHAGQHPKNVLADLQVGSSRSTGIPACAPTTADPNIPTITDGPTNDPGSASPSSTRHFAPEAHNSKVCLIGAGPGDPDLLTIKALRLLQSADIVLHDSLVSPEILNLIPASAQRIDVGKRAGFRLLTQQDINSLLVDASRKHRLVVRLKGGDPLLFGRAAEEIEALRSANIPFEVVPGISAAFASAAAAKLSLTDRRLASHVLFTTFSRAPESQFLPGIGLTAETTVVVYMPGSDYAEVSTWLQTASVSPETPVLLLSKASRPDQSQHITTVAALADLSPLPAPALLIVGRVVSSLSDAASALDFFRDSIQGDSIHARFSESM